MPYTGGTTFLPTESRLKALCLCRVNALHGRDYISTGWVVLKAIESLNNVSMPYTGGTTFLPTSLRPSVYAGFKPLFFAHFSEYSDILAKQGAKVGKGRIVFFREQFSMFFIV